MVTHLLRLRLLVLKNSLLRSTGQLVAVIIGALYGLGVLFGATIGLVALSGAPVTVARTVVVLAGSALLLGWIVVPLFTSGIDQTLEPARLVTFPIPLNTLLIGLALGGLVGVPGIVTMLASLATAGTWWPHPLIALIAAVSAAIAAATCIVGSRAVFTVSGTFTSGRRFREAAGFLAIIPLVLLGPIIVSLSSGIRTATDVLPGLADSLAWTPLGALWAVPSDVALGRWGVAGLHFLIGVVTFALLVLLWRRSLAVALVTPAHSTVRSRGRGKLGLFGVFPATPAGAVAARSLTYWMRDPRYARQLLVVPLIPVLMFFYSRYGSLELLNAVGPLVAVLLSLSIFTDLSYEGTAFATQVASGVRGRDDRLGRAAALASFGLPIVILLTIGSVWISGSSAVLPGQLGLSIGIFLSGLGVSSLASAYIIIPVPGPGDNPFKAAPGAGFTSALTTFATWGVLGVLVMPELVLAVVGAATGTAILGWIGLVVGVGLGTVVLVAGIRLGGAQIDRAAPELLEHLARQR
ncbi:MAG: transporter [Actinomycetota bacterium]